jgi:hypothetical protein
VAAVAAALALPQLVLFIVGAAALDESRGASFSASSLLAESLREDRRVLTRCERRGRPLGAAPPPCLLKLASRLCGFPSLVFVASSLEEVLSFSMAAADDLGDTFELGGAMRNALASPPLPVESLGETLGGETLGTLGGETLGGDARSAASSGDALGDDFRLAEGLLDERLLVSLSLSSHACTWRGDLSDSSWPFEWRVPSGLAWTAVTSDPLVVEVEEVEVGGEGALLGRS